MAIKREDISSLKEGEVVHYSGKDAHGKDLYLLVHEVDLERGVVSGEITSAYGVNNLSIDYLVKNGLDIAKWSNPQSYLEEEKEYARRAERDLPGLLQKGIDAVNDFSDEDFGPQGKHPFKHGGDPPHPNKKY